MAQLIGLVVILGIIGLIIGLIGAAIYLFVIYLLPFLLVGGAIFWIARHPYYAAKQRYEVVAATLAQQSFPPRALFRDAIVELYEGEVKKRGIHFPSKELCAALFAAIDTLYEREAFATRFAMPARPEFEWKLRPNYQYLQTQLDSLDASLNQFPEVKRQFAGACVDMLVLFTIALPHTAVRSWEEFRSGTSSPPSFLTLPVCELMHRVGDVVQYFVGAFNSSHAESLELFNSLRSTYRDARAAISAEVLTKTALKEGHFVRPDQYSGSPSELVKGYLRRTPWYDAFTTPVPFTFDELRFQHQWIVAPPGSGKTQLLKAQIVADLKKVERGEASIVVIDSQGTKAGTLLGDLIKLKLFAPGQPLADRLVFLDPDPAHPLALNLFDFGVEKLDALSERERRAYLTSVIDLTEFIITGLVGAEQTPMMKGISRYIIQALMVIPGATIATFRDLMSKEGMEILRPHLSKLDEYTRDFFEKRFGAAQYDATKAGIFWRLDTMMSDPTFREMFLNSRNRLDLTGELNAGKVIVVNTDLELLKRDGTETFGRFILAKLLLATQQRASDPNPKPTFVYIDEAQDYIADEERIADLIDKARKQMVGFIFAHQRLNNIRSANVADALANTAIQFAGGNKTDAAALARLLHTGPDFIENQPRLSFAVYVKGRDRAVQVKVPYGLMDNMEKMSGEDEAQMRAQMRDRYCASRTTSPAKMLPMSTDIVDTGPSPAWGQGI